jgi:hypothetical protein
MTMDEKIRAIKNASDRLHSLMSDPQPGLFTWVGMVGRVLTELAAFAPTTEHKGDADAG